MILDKIVEKRILQLSREKEKYPLPKMIEAAQAAAGTPRSLYNALSGPKLSVIAEVKKASPSKGVLCEDFRPVEIAGQYEAGGADAVSVLTEEFYFKGSAEYLRQARKAIGLPILRKDFIIDEYQIYEARAIGSDAVLLIAALLSKKALTAFIKLAKSLRLDCLVEVHDKEELKKVLGCGAKIIGVNNRDLKTFQVDLETTERLSPLVPKSCVLVSESGIRTHEDMLRLHTCGANAVLIGERLMRSGDIGATLKVLREGI